MGDLEVSPKRRRLDDSETDPDGKNKPNAFLLDKKDNVQRTEYCSKTIPHKEMNWNPKQVRPEVPQWYRRIVDGLKQREPKSMNSFERDAVHREASINSQTSPNAAKKEFLGFLKNVGDKETTSKADEPLANCPTSGLSQDVTRKSPVSPNGEDKWTSARQGQTYSDKPVLHKLTGAVNDGCTPESQVIPQQNYSEFALSGLMSSRDNIREEIKKIIKNRTIQTLAEAEKLQLRVFTLETENRNLKQKVKTLYNAVKGIHSQQNKELSRTNLTSRMVQTEPQVHAVDDTTMGQMQSVKSLPVTAIGSGTLPTASNKPLSVVSKTHQISVSPQRNASHCMTSVNQKGPHEQETLVCTGSHSFSPVHNKRTETGSVNLSKYQPVMSQTPYCHTKKPSLDYGSGGHLSASNSVATPPTYNHTTGNLKRNPVTCLNEVIQQILPESYMTMKEKVNKLSGLDASRRSSLNELSPECNAAGLPSANNKRPEVDSITSLHQQNSLPSLINKDCEKSISNVKKSEKTERRCCVANSDCKTQTKVSLPATSASHLRKHDAVKDIIKSRKPLGDSYLLTTAVESEAPVVVADSESQPVEAVSPLFDTFVRLLSQPSKTDHSAPMTSGFRSLVSPSTITRNQSTGSRKGIFTISETPGLGPKATTQIPCPVKSTSTQTSQLPGKGIRYERTKKIQMNLKGSGVKEINGDSNSVTLYKPPFSSNSQYYPSTAGSSICLSNLGNPYPVYKGHRRENPVALQQTTCKVEGRMTDKTSAKNPGVTSNEISFFKSQKMIDDQTLPRKSAASCESRFGGVFPKECQMMLHPHSRALEDRGFLSLDRIYHDREVGQQYKPRPAVKPNVVISQQRYQPYPTIRIKGQESHKLPIGSNTHCVHRMYHRRSPKTNGSPSLEVPLHPDPQLSRKHRSGFIQIECMHKNMPPKCSRSPEPAMYQKRFESYALLNSKLNSRSTNTLHPPQLNQGLSQVPRYPPTTSGSLSNELCSARPTNKRVNSPSKDPKTSKSGLYDSSSRNALRDNKEATRESLIFNCTSLSDDHSSVGKDDETDYRTPKRSLKETSSQQNCSAKPHVEMSPICQRYLNELRKAINWKPTINSEMKQESDSCQQHTVKMGSLKRQREDHNDQLKKIPRSSSTQGNKNDNHVQLHHKPRRLIFHHLKLTSPQPGTQALHEGRSNFVHCENTPQSKQIPEEKLRARNLKTESKIELKSTQTSLKGVNNEPSKE